MAALTLELPPDLYARLRAEAEGRGTSAEAVAREWLAERLAPSTSAAAGDERPATTPPDRLSDRDRMTEVLRAAGMLAELSPEEQRRAEQSTATLEEVRAALDRAGGQPLSELILEMRGPKG